MPVTLSLDNAPYQSWSAGTGHRDTLVPGGRHSVVFAMGQFESVLWLDQLSFTPAQPVSVSEALDNAELQFTTAGHRTWQGLGSLPSVGKGDDVLVLDNPVPTSAGTLSAEVSGPALISFNYKQSIGVSQGMFTGVAPTPVPVLPGFDPDWSTGYVLVPEGATQINWTGWGTAKLDDFQRAPEAEAARLRGALGTTDLAWSGTSNVPWEVTGSPEAVRVGLPADVTGRIDSRLRTEVIGPAVIDFQAIVDSNASDNENWNFEVSLQSVTDNFYRAWPLTATDGYWRNVRIPIPAGSHTFTVAAYTPYPGNGMTLRNFRLTPVDIPLATAIGAPGLDWHTGDNAPWIGQPESRGYSVISCQVPAGETSWLETTVRGPVDIAFARIAQANNVSHFTARFSIDGVGVETINSIGYWQTRTYSLDEARDYVLRWELTPTAEAPTGADPAFVVSDFRFLGTYEQKVTALALPTAKSAPSDDADYDGLTNELELKLGTDPLQPDHNSVQLVPTPFGLEFSYPIPDSSALEPLPPDGDAIVVEISPDLMSWEQLPPFTRRFADPFGITGYRARVQLPQPTTGDSMYVRLRAEETEQQNYAE